MDDVKKIKLKQSGLNAYIKLIAPTRAQLYIPGKLDTILFRNAEGAWLLDHTKKNVMEAFWDQRVAADIYGTGGDSVETVLNDELATLVNGVMFE